MAKKNVAARAERIIRLLPTILGSMASWHQDRTIAGTGENRRSDRLINDVKIPRGNGLNLTFHQYQALTAIRDLGQCSVNGLGDTLGIAQSTASQLVDRLVKGGFVRREIFGGDRRRMVVTLSKAGSQMMEQRRQSLLRTYTQILRMLDEGDQEMLEDAFEKFSRVAAKVDPASTKRWRAR